MGAILIDYQFENGRRYLAFPPGDWHQIECLSTTSSPCRSCLAAAVPPDGRTYKLLVASILHDTLTLPDQTGFVSRIGSLGATPPSALSSMHSALTILEFFLLMFVSFCTDAGEGSWRDVPGEFMSSLRRPNVRSQGWHLRASMSVEFSAHHHETKNMTELTGPCLKFVS